MPLRRKRTAFYAVVLERRSQCVACRALKVPNTVAYLYLMDVSRNGSAAPFLAGCIAEVGYAVLSLRAFLRTVQYGMVSCFVHDQMWSGFTGRGTLLHVPWMLVGQWSRNGILGIAEDTDMDQVLALLALVRVAETV